jgi:hypothetical protein
MGSNRREDALGLIEIDPKTVVSKRTSQIQFIGLLDRRSAPKRFAAICLAQFKRLRWKRA